MPDAPATAGRDPAAPWAVPGPGPAAALDAARGARLVLEDYRPLADSLEWRLGQEFLRRSGAAAFAGDEPVPFVVNNDGNQSARAAEVVFASLAAAEAGGALPPGELFVLELGVGVGLFARYFLDWFRQLCDREGKDYYDRLCYLAADRSARMLRDAGRCGVFQGHPGRYRLILADALRPAEALLADPQVGAAGPRPLQAVFLNYLLDCLPACVVRAEGGQLELLHARTSLPAGADWRGLCDVRPEDLQRLAARPGAEGSAELLAVYPLVQADYDFRPAAPEQVPYAEFALREAAAVAGRPVVHSHGAAACLEALLSLLADGGVVLIGDYGQTEAAADDFEHQRFAQATFVGVNFALLGKYFSEGERGCWREPPGDDQSLHCRLLTRRPHAAAALRFVECYGEAARRWQQAPAERARELGGCAAPSGSTARRWRGSRSPGRCCARRRTS